MTEQRQDAQPKPSQEEAAAAAGRGMRPEIQVLRAAAVLAVVFNHLAPGLLPGGYIGVDIFFVISGYLITAHLMRELESTGRIRLGAFWARRVRRLLPASLLVLIVSAVATALVVPATLWQQVARQITASALYVQNWALASDSQDYFASADSPSPATHYWSLSVEEQFYLVWPLIALGAYVLGRKLGRPRAGVMVAFVAVVVSSLAFAVWALADSPSAAYFVTPARMWQLGTGGVLALVPALSRGRHVVALAGWVALLGSVLRFDDSTGVPGPVALVPVLGTAAVIWSGDAFLRRVPGPLRPGVTAALWVGGISYSLYLWHWPPIVLVPHATGEPLTVLTKLLILALILPLSWLSMRLVEDPVRRLAWFTHGSLRRTFLPLGVCTAAVVLASTQLANQAGDRVEQVTAEVNAAVVSEDECFAARAMDNDCEDPHLLRLADSTLLRVDNDTTADPRWGETCIQESTAPQVMGCEFGVPAEKASLRVALVGDSHARHWTPALDELAVEHDWNVTMYVKGSCPANAAPLRTRNFPQYIDSCRSWNEGVARKVADDDSLDMVITSGFSRNYIIDGLGPKATRRDKVRGYQELWKEWTDAGKTVVALGDVPKMGRGDIPECVDNAKSRRDPCGQEARKALTPDAMLLAARGPNPDVFPVDLRRFFCSEGTCHSVIGGVVAYGDENHLIGYFARTLAPYLEKEMRPAVPTGKR